MLPGKRCGDPSTCGCQEPASKVPPCCFLKAFGGLQLPLCVVDNACCENDTSLQDWRKPLFSTSPGQCKTNGILALTSHQPQCLAPAIEEVSPEKREVEMSRECEAAIYRSEGTSIISGSLLRSIELILCLRFLSLSAMPRQAACSPC